MDAGTGIWAHDETKAITYTSLLQRFFSQLSQKNPDHALSGTKSYKIPASSVHARRQQENRLRQHCRHLQAHEENRGARHGIPLC